MLPDLEWTKTAVDLRKYAGRLRLTDAAIDRRSGYRRRGRQREPWPQERYTRALSWWARRRAARVGVICGPVRIATDRDYATDQRWLRWSVYTAPADSGLTEANLRRARDRNQTRVYVHRLIHPARSE